MRLFGRHNQGFSGVQQVYPAVYGELAGSFQDGSHGVPVRIMGADFLVLIKGKERDAYSAVLGQGFADNLAWLGDYLAAQGQRLFVGNVFIGASSLIQNLSVCGNCDNLPGNKFPAG